MTVREWAEKNQAFTIILLLLAIAGAIIFVVNSGSASVAQRAVRAKKAYFSDDDGQTFFTDSIDQVPPFDHDGKQAYRAAVYKCGSNAPFVGFLERYTDATRAKIAKLKTDAEQNELAIQDAMNGGIEVKKPGDSKWVPRLSSQGAGVAATPKCPDGGKVVGVAP